MANGGWAFAPKNLSDGDFRAHVDCALLGEAVLIRQVASP